MIAPARPFDPHKPIRTLDGRAARFEGYANPPQMMGPYAYPIVASVECPSEPGGWTRWHYMLNGQWKSDEPGNGNDLVNVVLQ